MVDPVVRVVRLHHHAVAIGAGRSLVRRGRAVATGTRQRGLGVVHRGTWTPLRIARRRAAGMAVIARCTTRRQNVRTRREVCRAQHRRTILVGSIVTGRTSARGSRNVRMVLATRPGRCGHVADGCGQRGGMANIARPCEWNVAMPTPQCGIGRGSRAVVAGRTLASIRGNVGVRGSQPTGR